MHANVRSLTGLLGPSTAFCAVVKANAYGHNIEVMTKLLSEAGVTHFGVDSLDEALAVRRIAPAATVFILGMTPVERLPETVQHDLVQNVVDEESLFALADAAAHMQRIAKVNIEIETGLNRLGVSERSLTDLLRIIRQNPRALHLAGISTHLSTAENVNAQNVVDDQLARFAQAQQLCETTGVIPDVAHVACSAAVIMRPQTHCSMVRTGIATYGIWPDQELKLAVQRGRAFELSPVLAWRSTVAQVKDVPNGGAVGYSRSFIANRPMRIAVLPVGYYDGFDRGLSGKGKVLIRGRLCPVIGRVCMNMIMVDVSALPHVKTGDMVTLIGKDGMHAITTDDIANELGTISYEVVTRINPSIPRIVV